MTTPGTSTADLPDRWRAHAWVEYARGRADLAALLWACANDLEEAPMPTLPTGPVQRWTYRSTKTSGALTRRQLWVIHTAECPMAAGRAASVTQWGATTDVQASWHYMAGPDGIASMIAPDKSAWHATRANRVSIGIEQAGRASQTRADWLTPDGLATIANAARAAVESGLTRPVVITDPAVVDRILSGQDTTTTGYVSHALIQPRDRTDPGAGYPWDVLLDFTRQLLNPTPITEGLTMADIDDIIRRLADIEDSIGRARASIAANGTALADQVSVLRDRVDAVAKAPTGGPTAAEVAAEIIKQMMGGHK